MATPVGHFLIGLSITQVFARSPIERRRGLWLATVACVPDLDVLPGLVVGNMAQFHHGASHSLAVAAIFAIAGSLLLGRKEWKYSLELLLLFFLLYASHAILDFFTFDRAPPYGVPLFWPWIRESYQSGWPLLPHVQHTAAPLASVHNLLLMIQEILVFLPLTGVILSLKISRWPWTQKAAWLYSSWFLIAVLASLLALR